MTFRVSADAYDRFMGRFSVPLADEFLLLTGLRRGMRALDVGSGPGALTSGLVAELGVDHVAAVDPEQGFVDAITERLPGVEARVASAEHLPFPDESYDAAMAQLVLHFMADPVLGLREMGRVTHRGGVVAACVWDHAGNGSPLSLFWSAVARLDPGARGEASLPGTRQGHLGELARSAALRVTKETRLTVTVPFATFGDWWAPFELGVGPAGAYVAGLGRDGRDRLAEQSRTMLPDEPFEVSASAWAILATPST